MKSVTLPSEMNPSEYHSLIDVISVYSATVKFVVRDSFKSAIFVEHLKESGINAVSIKIVTKWPGTELLNGHAKLFEYRLTDRVIETLKSKATSLYDWLEPELPEDLSFYRSDGSLILGSVSHELDSWVVVDDRELLQLQTMIPTFL